MKAKVVKRQLDSEKEMNTKDAEMLFKPEAPRVKSIALSDQVANSRIVFKNYKWKEALEDFPQEPWMRHVSKFYPYSSIGQLLIDEPQQDIDLHKCERRKEVLRKHGYKYLILTKESTLETALEDLKQWLGQPS